MLKPEMKAVFTERLEARPAAKIPASEAEVRLEDFVAYLPKHNFIFLPTREPWPASSVNARIPPVPLVDDDGRPVLNGDGEQEFISASAWLDKNRPVEQMTWCPGLPMLIKDRLVAEGGWIERPGCTILNLYRPPILPLGKLVGPLIAYTETYDFQCDKATFAKLLKLNKDQAVERLLTASGDEDGLREINRGAWGDFNVGLGPPTTRPYPKRLDERVNFDPRSGWTGMGSPEWLEELFPNWNESCERKTGKTRQEAAE